MTIEDRLIDYFSRRRIVLSKQTAKYVVQLIKNHSDDAIATVVKHKFNSVSNGYEVIRTLLVPIEKIESYYLTKSKPIHGFYMYIITKADGIILEPIYSINPSLFD